MIATTLPARVPPPRTPRPAPRGRARRGVRPIAFQLYVGVVLFFATGAVFPLLHANAGLVLKDDVSVGDRSLQLAWAAIYLSALLRVLSHRRGIRTAIAAFWRDRVLALFTTYAVLSVAWSTQPDVSIRRAVALLGTTLVGVMIGQRLSAEALLRVLTWTLSIVLVLSAGAILVAPEMGTYVDYKDFAWRGVFLNKNQFGRILVLTALVLWLRLHQRAPNRLLAMGAIAATLGCLVMSQSKTSWVILLGLVAVWPSVRVLRWPAKLALAGFVAIAISTCAAVGLMAANLDVLLGELGKSSTLTGRTTMWPVLLAAARRHLWFGYGYSGFWSSDTYRRLGLWWNPGHAHNGFLEVLLQLGVVGLLFYLAQFLVAMVRACRFARNQHDVAGLWPVLFLVFVFPYNVTENIAVNGNTIYWMLYVAASVLVAGAHRRAVRGAEPAGHGRKPVRGWSGGGAQGGTGARRPAPPPRGAAVSMRGG